MEASYGGIDLHSNNSLVVKDPEGKVLYRRRLDNDLQRIERALAPGNINFNPVFAGTGCAADDLKLVLGSPAIDSGNPDPTYNDACFPPSLATARNDMGAFGGPGACNFASTP